MADPQKEVPIILVTSKEIRRPEDLKGKKLGVSRIGSSSDSILRLALRKLGLNPEKDVAILVEQIERNHSLAFIGPILAENSGRGCGL